MTKIQTMMSKQPHRKYQKRKEDQGQENSQLSVKQGARLDTNDEMESLKLFVI